MSEAEIDALFVEMYEYQKAMGAGDDSAIQWAIAQLEDMGLM